MTFSFQGTFNFVEQLSLFGLLDLLFWLICFHILIQMNYVPKLDTTFMLKMHYLWCVFEYFTFFDHFKILEPVFICTH